MLLRIRKKKPLFYLEADAKIRKNLMISEGGEKSKRKTQIGEAVVDEVRSMKDE